MSSQAKGKKIIFFILQKCISLYGAPPLWPCVLNKWKIDRGHRFSPISSSPSLFRQTTSCLLQSTGDWFYFFFVLKKMWAHHRHEIEGTLLTIPCLRLSVINWQILSRISSFFLLLSCRAPHKIILGGEFRRDGFCRTEILLWMKDE